MKLCRFDDDRLGVVEGDSVLDVTTALDVLPAVRWPLPLGDLLVANLEQVRGRIMDLLPAASGKPLTSVALLSPVANPTKIIGAPVNYRAHVAEIDDSIRQGHDVKSIADWGLFLKANSALAGPSQPIPQRFLDARTDHEIELAVIIGRGGTNIAREDALDYIAGYAIGLDITLRGPQFQSFRKSIDGYAVVGPWLVTADEIPDPGALSLSLAIDGIERQHGSTAQMIYDVQQLIVFASSFYTLIPGDIIMTGTPDGVGPIRPGNSIEAEIEAIGRMTVSVG